jgi:ABC-type antimicrobial peptide transport system permease subunit
MLIVIRQGAWMIVFGLAAGIGTAYAARRAMSTLVFGVPTLDPSTYALSCVLLTLAALAGCVLPARRAATLDPVEALRSE